MILETDHCYPCWRSELILEDEKGKKEKSKNFRRYSFVWTFTTKKSEGKSSLGARESSCQRWVESETVFCSIVMKYRSRETITSWNSRNSTNFEGMYLRAEAELEAGIGTVEKPPTRTLTGIWNFWKIFSGQKVTDPERCPTRAKSAFTPPIVALRLIAATASRFTERQLDLWPRPSQLITFKYT